jgi:hypothetical protein
MLFHSGILNTPTYRTTVHSGMAGKGDQNHRIADYSASLLCEGLIVK